MSYSIDARHIQPQLEALPLATRVTIELKLKDVARFAGLNPPPSPIFLMLEGLDPISIFRFEVHGVRVSYEVDVDAQVVRATRAAWASQVRRVA